MKTLLRHLLINTVSLWLATILMPGLTYAGGVKSLIIGGAAFMVINFLLVPLLRILLLPLNLLTLGLFAWVVNVLALYALTTIVPEFQLVPYSFTGFSSNGVVIQPTELTPLMVAVVSSFIIGIITHFLSWLVHK